MRSKRDDEEALRERGSGDIKMGEGCSSISMASARATDSDDEESDWDSRDAATRDADAQ